MYYIVCYDITSNKRRRKLSKLLVNFLVRVQESVFEGWLKKHHFDKMMRFLTKIVDPQKDFVRIYTLSEPAHEKTVTIGKTGLITKREYMLIE